MPSRRNVLGGALLTTMASTTAFSADADGFEAARLEADMVHYSGLGIHQTGGAGDLATGDWIAARMAQMGLVVDRMPIDAPFFEPLVCQIGFGSETVPGLPQFPVTPTLGAGLAAPLAIRRDASDDAGLKGKIAVLQLPYARHSSLMSPPVEAAFRAAAAASARGIVAITNGPSGEALALNAPDGPVFGALPAIVVGPRAARPLVAAALAGAPATLTLTGKGGRRTSANIIGERKGTGRRVVITTPLSGWFNCAAERGSGIAAFLAIIPWLLKAHPDVHLTCAGMVGHEFENLGSEAFIEHRAPKPDEVDLWLHFGAGYASRDWHDGDRLSPQGTADGQRYLLVSPEMMTLVKPHMAGLPGFGSPFPATVAGAAGEAKTILSAGFQRVIANFGSHRLHHAQTDLPNATTGELIATTVRATRNAVDAWLSRA